MCIFQDVVVRCDIKRAFTRFACKHVVMFGFLAIIFRMVISFCLTVIIISFSLTVIVTVRTLFSIWNAVERCDLISVTKERFKPKHTSKYRTKAKNA